MPSPAGVGTIETSPLFSVADNEIALAFVGIDVLVEADAEFRREVQF